MSKSIPRIRSPAEIANGHEHPYTEERSPHFSKVLAAPHQQGASDSQLIAPLPRRCHSSIDTAILPFAACFGTAYGAVKMKALLVLSIVAFSLCISSPRCFAQELVPAIYLSPSEAAKAKPAVQDFKKSNPGLCSVNPTFPDVIGRTRSRRRSRKHVLRSSSGAATGHGLVF